MVDEVIRSYCNLPRNYDVEKWLETAPGRRQGLSALWSREEVDIDDDKKRMCTRISTQRRRTMSNSSVVFINEVSRNGYSTA